MSQLSEFRKKKLLFVFKVFFGSGKTVEPPQGYAIKPMNVLYTLSKTFNFADIDGSGSINDADFVLALQKVVKIRNFQKSDPKYAEYEKILQSVWNDLKASGDGNKDGEISNDEWCKMWQEYAQNPDKPQKWQSQYMDFIFDLQDSTADGKIDQSEFIAVCTSYGIDEAECKMAFSKFSANNTITITKAEFAKLWREFFTTDDINARGNFIFGKTNFG